MLLQSFAVELSAAALGALNQIILSLLHRLLHLFFVDGFLLLRYINGFFGLIHDSILRGHFDFLHHFLHGLFGLFSDENSFLGGPQGIRFDRRLSFLSLGDIVVDDQPQLFSLVGELQLGLIQILGG